MVMRIDTFLQYQLQNGLTITAEKEEEKII